MSILAIVFDEFNIREISKLFEIFFKKKVIIRVREYFDHS